MNKRILIIDDEKRMADSLRSLLGSQGYEAEVAYGGAEGIDALGKSAFPVVITDLRMREVGGLEVIRYVAENLPKTLVIVVTGYASTESAIEALHYHAFDYLRKPFEFDQMKTVIERAFNKLEVDQLRADMAAMITHDIKVPLTSILGFASLLYSRETETVHPRAKEFADNICGGARKILDLIDNYLTTAQAEAEDLAAHPRKVHLKYLVDDLVDVVSAEAERLGFELRASLEESLEVANLDEPLIYRGMGNLMQNALKYGDPAEHVALNLLRVDAESSPLGKESLRFEVENLAPSLNVDSLETLFHRFERAAPDTGIEGSGIGLYVVNAVARAHGGVAQAERRSEHRVCFSITIPMDLEEIGSAGGGAGSAE